MFYENLSCEELQFILPLGDDLSGNLTFKIPPNSGRGKDFVISHGNSPFNFTNSDLDGLDTLHLILTYRLDNSHNTPLLSINFGLLSDPSAATVSGMMTVLNSDPSFNDLFTASKKINHNGTPIEQLIITKKHPGIIDFAVVPFSADRTLLFNKYSGIAEIPDFFNPGNLVSPLQYPFSNSAANPTIVTSDGVGQIDSPTLYFARSNSDPVIDGLQTITKIDDTTLSVPVNVTTAGTTGYFCSLEQKYRIERAGFSVDRTKLDWEHLQGRASSFPITMNTVDISNRVTSSVVYNAGALPGTICKKTYYSYTSSNTTPDSVFEIPHVLTANDITGL